MMKIVHPRGVLNAGRGTNMRLARAFQPMSCSGRQARPQLSLSAANLERGVAARARAGATQPSASHS